MRWVRRRNKQNFIQVQPLSGSLRDLQVSIVDGIECASEEADAPAMYHQARPAAFRLEIWSRAAWLANSSHRLLSSCDACPLVHSHFSLWLPTKPSSSIQRSWLTTGFLSEVFQPFRFHPCIQVVIPFFR